LHLLGEAAGRQLVPLATHSARGRFARLAGLAWRISR